MVALSQAVAEKEKSLSFERDRTLVESEQAVAANVNAVAANVRFGDPSLGVPHRTQRNRRKSRFLPAAGCGAW